MTVRLNVSAALHPRRQVLPQLYIDQRGFAGGKGAGQCGADLFRAFAMFAMSAHRLDDFVIAGISMAASPGKGSF